MECPSVSPRAGYWQELIDQQRLGGLSVKQFCFEKNVSVASFYQWRRRLTASKDLIESPESATPSRASSTAMIPIRLVSPPRPQPAPAAVQILTPNGYSLRVDSSTCPEQLRMILEAVQASGSGAPSC